MRRLLAIVLGIIVCGNTCQPSALAHDPGLSHLEVTVGPETTVARMTLASQDAGRLLALGDVTQDFEPHRLLVEELALSQVTITSEGTPWVAFQSRMTWMARDNDLILEIWFETRPGPFVRVHSPGVPRLARGHRQSLKVLEDSGQPWGETLLDARHASIQFSRPEIKPEESPSASPLLGHVANQGTGLSMFDQVLILLALLLGMMFVVLRTLLVLGRKS